MWVYLACRCWGGVWGLKTAERGGDEFGKWCPGGELAVVQWVLGEEEEVGMIAECCDSRLHSLHRAVGVRCSGWGWSRKGRWYPCRGIRGGVRGGLLAGNASSAEGGTKCGLGDEERVHFLVYPRVRWRCSPGGW